MLDGNAFYTNEEILRSLAPHAQRAIAERRPRSEFAWLAATAASASETSDEGFHNTLELVRFVYDDKRRVWTAHPLPHSRALGVLGVVELPRGSGFAADEGWVERLRCFSSVAHMLSTQAAEGLEDH